jgi:hypothetical protein
MHGQMPTLVKLIVVVVSVGVCVAFYMMYAHATKSATSVETVTQKMAVLDTQYTNISKDMSKLKIAKLGNANNNESTAHTCTEAWKRPVKLTGSVINTSAILKNGRRHRKGCYFYPDAINAHWEMLQSVTGGVTGGEKASWFQLSNVGESVAEDCTILYDKPTVNAQTCVRGVSQSGKVIIYNGDGTLISLESNQMCTSCKQVT